MAANGLLATYLARHWCTVPVHRPNLDNATCSCGKPDCAKPGKHPVARHWPAGSTNPSDFANCNIGIRVGPDSANLADVDLDCGEAVAVGPSLLPATNSAFGRSGQVTHALYTVPARDAIYLKLQDPVLSGDNSTIVELRWPEWDEDKQRYKALQTVFPPSLHHNGGTVEWIHDGTPAEVVGTKLVTAVRHVGAAVLLARYAKPQERHGLVLLLANLLVRTGWQEDVKIVQFITAVFVAKNDSEKAKKVAEGEGIGAVKDSRKRLKSGKAMKGLPALKDMLDSALDNKTADKVVANVANWLGLPDSSGPRVTVGAGPSGHKPGTAALPGAVPIPPYVPFPTDLLPPVVRAYVEETAAAMNCDSAYSALPALAALGAAVGASHVASPKKGWKEPPYVWALPIGKSGAVKSPPYRDVEDAAEDINDRLEAEHEVAAAEFEARMEAWSAAKKDGGDPGPRPTPPVLRSFIKGDVTIEALVGELQDNPRGLLIGQDELSAWVSGFVKYSGKTGASDLQRWLQLHNAGSINYTRKTGDRRRVRVRGVGVSVAGTIQPKILSRVLTEEFRASGFLARLLLALPPWRKRQWTEAEVDDSTRAGFADLLGELHALPRGEWPDGRPAPHLVRLSDEAKAAFVAFYNANGDALGSADEDMSAAMSKLEGYALRFALIFHCCRLKEYAKDTRITADDMAAAIRLTGWFRNEAERVYTALGETPEEQAARHQSEVVARLAERRGGRITAFELHRTNRRKYPTTESAEVILETLVTHGFGAWEAPQGAPTAGRPTRHYVPRDPVPEIPEIPNDEETGVDPEGATPESCSPKSPAWAQGAGNPHPQNGLEKTGVTPSPEGREGISGISGTTSGRSPTAAEHAGESGEALPVDEGIFGSTVSETPDDEFPFEEVL